LYRTPDDERLFLDFKLSLRFENRMFSFGLFPGVCSLIANVSLVNAVGFILDKAVDPYKSESKNTTDIQDWFKLTNQQ
jgi:hypothetical protein